MEVVTTEVELWHGIVLVGHVTSRCLCRLRYSYTSAAAAAAERSVLLVNYENQRNAFKLVDIKASPPSPPTDLIYGSPRRWFDDGNSTLPPSHLLASPAAALYSAADASANCNCVYSAADLRPCGCPPPFHRLDVEVDLRSPRVSPRVCDRDDRGTAATLDL